MILSSLKIHRYLLIFSSMLIHMAYGASNHAATEQVQAQLVASVDAVIPGGDIYLGVQQIIVPHWHTYWLNPGDSGLPTTIEWTLPAGATASDILWPTPGHSRLGPIVNYSYENEVTLLSKINVPSNLAAGDYFNVQAKVDWLVCAAECIPQQVTLALELPVIAAGAPTGAGSPLIKQALARLPVPSPLPVAASIDHGKVSINIKGVGAQAKHIKEIWFYPLEWGRIQQSADQAWRIDGDDILLDLQSGDSPFNMGDLLNGVLVITEQGADDTAARGYTLRTLIASPNNPPDTGLLTALLLALLGGIILNLMPCVFPVLSIKVLSLVAHSQQTPRQVRLHGLSYAAGVLISFLILGLVIILCKAGGAQIGWGFQFQSPVFVVAVAYLLFAVGLSLSGVFFVGGTISNLGSSLTQRSGYTGSFFTGVLATIVATPCTAPFMAAALGYALAQPPVSLLAIFIALGAGLAFPYVLLTHLPALQRWLPRPGVWMERVKQALAFPMYAAAVWLIWVLAQQAGATAVAAALCGMVLIALAAWVYDISRAGSNHVRWFANLLTVLALVISLVTGYIGAQSEVEPTTANAEKHWELYSEARLNDLLAEGKPVFLNFTASWCISCLVNERVALSNAKVIDAFSTRGITYLKGDWTKRDSAITRVLKKFGRSGVPLYVFYAVGQKDNPVELPQILTPDIVLSVIQPTQLDITKTP